METKLLPITMLRCPRIELVTLSRSPRPQLRKLRLTKQLYANPKTIDGLSPEQASAPIRRRSLRGWTFIVVAGRPR
jgi:hypothetical protein